MVSIKPRNQRREMFNAPKHKRRKWISSHLEENLLLKYDRRSIPVIKGDTVRVMRGSFKGHENKIASVDTRKRHLEIEGITMSKADGNKIGKPIHASNVIITKLNLTDKWRREKLERNLSEETKKEIEKEAEVQIKQAEEAKKAEEEKKKLEELEKQKEESTETKEEIVEEKPKTEEKELIEKPTQKEELIEKEKKAPAKKPKTTKTKTKKTTKKTEKNEEESK